MKQNTSLYTLIVAIGFKIMNVFNSRKFIYLFLIALTGALIFFSFSSIQGFLSKNEPVNANILVVEGWLPDYAMKKAAEEFNDGAYDYIITSGLKLPDYFILFTNSSLNFKLAQSEVRSDSSMHKIEIKASGSLGRDHPSHFNVWINDSLAANFYTDKKIETFSFSWNCPLHETDSIRVEFDNDGLFPEGDRNLIIYWMSIDNITFTAYSNNVSLSRTDRDGTYRSREISSSYAIEGKELLIQYGIGPDKIIPVTAERVVYNRTFCSALAVKEWLEKNEITVEGINLYSLGIHSRRSWITYRNLLEKEYPVGVISGEQKFYSRRHIIIPLGRELIGYIWYRAVLLPYFKFKHII